MATKKKAVKKQVEIVTDEDEELTKRMDWERNQELVSDAYFSLSMKKKKFPTLAEIAKETGLSVKTVQRHLQAEQFEKTMESLRATRPAMVMKFMGLVATSKNPNMWDLWWSLTEKEYSDSKRNKKVDVTTGGKPLNESIDYSKLSTKALQELINAAESTESKS